jgi:hypothetical protein
MEATKKLTDAHHALRRERLQRFQAPHSLGKAAFACPEVDLEKEYGALSSELSLTEEGEKSTHHFAR